MELFNTGKEEFEISFVIAESENGLCCDINEEVLRDVHGPVKDAKRHKATFKLPTYEDTVQIEMGTVQVHYGEMVTNREKLDNRRLSTLLKKWTLPDDPTPESVYNLPHEIKSVLAYLVHFHLLGEDVPLPTPDDAPSLTEVIPESVEATVADGHAVADKDDHQSGDSNGAAEEGAAEEVDNQYGDAKEVEPDSPR